jgi:AcrR family transcriptional regulator
MTVAPARTDAGAAAARATEDAILAAGAVLEEVPFSDLRMDMIARRAFVSAPRFTST